MFDWVYLIAATLVAPRDPKALQEGESTTAHFEFKKKETIFLGLRFFSGEILPGRLVVPSYKIVINLT